jgi:UDP-N-acetylglucosamine:LPS N-acetylglucosamine transferase
MKSKYVINVVTGQGGGGHYATYHAIRTLAAQQQLPWEFQVTDMDAIITGLSQQNQVKNAYELFGFSGHDLYNVMVKNGWTWLWPLKMRLNKFLVKLNHEIGIKLFEQYWREQDPDLVVSVMPLYNKGLWESLQRAKPGIPFVTVMTDFADCPPAFWIDPEIKNHLVCGTEKAVEQARSLGVEEARIIRTLGLVIHPNFCQSNKFSDRARERQRLGLDPDRLTAIVTFGGNGSQTMLEIANRLERFHDNLQLIFMCGHNEEVAAKLNQRQGSQKYYVATFTEDMSYYMGLADFFIGKPGNVSISEAIAMKLPVITECNRFTMIQERDCAEWVAAKEIGIVIPSFKKVDQAVTTLIQPQNYLHYRSNLAALSNQAVFEVANVLKGMLRQSNLEPSLSVTLKE